MSGRDKVKYCKPPTIFLYSVGFVVVWSSSLGSGFMAMGVANEKQSIIFAREKGLECILFVR